MILLSSRMSSGYTILPTDSITQPDAGVKRMDDKLREMELAASDPLFLSIHPAIRCSILPARIEQRIRGGTESAPRRHDSFNPPIRCSISIESPEDEDRTTNPRRNRIRPAQRRFDPSRDSLFYFHSLPKIRAVGGALRPPHPPRGSSPRTGHRGQMTGNRVLTENSWQHETR